MKKIQLLLGLPLLLFTILAGCSFNKSISQADEQQIIKHVITVEESDTELINFRQTYEQYYDVIREIVSDEHWAAISERTVFGYDDEVYTIDDLSRMTKEEYDKHKDRMLNIIHGLEFNKINATIHISNVYKEDKSNQAFVFIYEDKELKGSPFTTATKKYTLEKHNEKWLIIDVQQDKFTYGIDQTTEERAETIKKLKYQTYNDEVIEYATVIVLPGEGKQ